MNEYKQNTNDSDPEKYWTGAEKMLDAHYKKKRAVARYTVLTVLGLLLIGSYWFFNSTEHQVPGTKTNLSQQPSASPQGNIQPQQISPSGSNPSLQIEKEVAPSETLVEKNPFKSNTNQPEIQKSESQLTPGHPNQTIAPGDKTMVAPVAVAPIMAEHRNNSSTSSNPANNSREFSTASNPAGAVTAQPGKDADGLNTTNPGDAGSIKSDSYTAPGISFIAPINKFEIPEPSRELSLSLSPSSIAPLLPAAAPKSKGNIDLSVLVYATPLYVTKTLSAEVEDEYLMRRQNEEDNIMTAGIGASLKAAIKNFSAGIGIEYSYLGEKINYAPYSHQNQLIQSGDWQSYQYTTIDTDTAFVTGIQFFIQTSVQRTDSLYQSHTDTVGVSVYDEQISAHNGTNKFYYLEVPLEFSYIISRNKLGFGVSAGISPAWQTNQQGYYLKRDASGIESVEEARSINSFTVNGRLSLDFLYKLNPRINLVLRPQYKTNLQSVLNKDYNVNQKYHSYGINFGVLYSLK